MFLACMDRLGWYQVQQTNQSLLIDVFSFHLALCFLNNMSNSTVQLSVAIW